MSAPRRIITLGVLAGAYRGGRASLKATLTHSVEADVTDVALCGQENMADESSATPEAHAARPGCPKCAIRDPRFNPQRADEAANGDVECSVCNRRFYSSQSITDDAVICPDHRRRKR